MTPLRLRLSIVILKESQPDVTPQQRLQTSLHRYQLGDSPQPDSPIKTADTLCRWRRRRPQFQPERHIVLRIVELQTPKEPLSPW